MVRLFGCLSRRCFASRGYFALALAVLMLAPGARANDAPKAAGQKAGEPTDAKARKTWDSALDWEKKGYQNIAVDELRQANKEDGGHCTECLRRAYSMAISISEYREAAAVAHDWLATAQTDTEKATIHSMLGESLQMQAIAYKKSKLFTDSCDEYKAALALDAHAPLTHFGYGVSLAHLRQDEAARGEFKAFLEQDKENPYLHFRAERFLERIDLARIPMAPDFALTTLDGQKITRDSLAGKVVLIDFWASWCAPCREAIPQIEKLVDEFGKGPFVAISVGLDKDQDTWRSFVRRYGMTWLQCYDGDFGGPLSRHFGVTAIPATFTIDADGILEDQRVGDANIEGKLKKMLARAAKMPASKAETATADKSAAGGK